MEAPREEPVSCHVKHFKINVDMDPEACGIEEPATLAALATSYLEQIHLGHSSVSFTIRLFQ